MKLAHTVVCARALVATEFEERSFKPIIKVSGDQPGGRLGIVSLRRWCG
uniref:Uncharacterized protein n=1 Tax=Anguilla anguilla TaxID=7936 RepID=A0A0E9U883_ANGAN